MFEAAFRDVKKASKAPGGDRENMNALSACSLYQILLSKITRYENVCILQHNKCTLSHKRLRWLNDKTSVANHVKILLG